MVNRQKQRRCYSKAPRTKEEAISKAESLTIQWREKVSAYECNFCGHWHIGKSRYRDEMMKIQAEVEEKKSAKTTDK